MLKRTVYGVFIVAFLLGTFGISASVSAAGIVTGIAQSCINGGFARYVDEDGDRFPDQQTCVGWVADHPGEPLLLDMAKLCSNGAHILYADDDGNAFTDEESCLSWVTDHPGMPPVAMDDGSDNTDG